jgi:hypothetical protein
MFGIGKAKLIAYQLYEADTAPIRASRRERKWMDESGERFAYRCLPLVMANQFGWEILSTHHFRASWDGTSRPEGLHIENLCGDGNLHCHSHFGGGILSFLMPFLFRTPSGWNLMIRGPMNSPKDGIVALDAIVETDWAHSTFTMNWRFTRACSVEFQVGEPICLLFPIQRGVLENFQGEIRMLTDEPALQKKYEEWSASRGQFLTRLCDHEPEAVKQGWQKHYMLASLQTRTTVNEFCRTPRTAIKSSSEAENTSDPVRELNGATHKIASGDAENSRITNCSK